ncbi:MAG: DNA-directed RNA polymerase subunit omega [Deltaproteobacteria bacterium]|nr:DNA-directed RNA polymerase subunit omega [Deltaproteobacteria bacterium]
MARITVEDCLELIGSENRFALIHLAIARLKQHRKGMPMLVEGKNKEVVMTLREIAAGKVTPENLKKFAESAKAEAAAEAAEVSAVLAETSETSGEVKAVPAPVKEQQEELAN